MARWWQEAVFYQVYPRSFLDTDGDGVGDIEGIRRKLGHLVDLGVDALWINPVYPSPNHDFGYDPTNLCDVHPALGTMADVDRLVEEAHARGLRVILDWVGNHTSAEHPWFVDASSSRNAAKRDWYVWHPGRGDGAPPNNWRSAMGGPAWTRHDATGEWYLHLFLSSQPDLNWSNPDLVDAMHSTLRFWLDRGIDGFRLDVPHCMGKDRTFADNPPELEHYRRSILNDCSETHGILQGIRKVLDDYDADDGRMSVGEVNLLTIDQLGPYVAADELHLAFNFPPTRSPWDAAEWRSHVAATESLFNRIDAWPTWFLSNHDYPRHRTRYGGSEARARAAAVLLLTLRGTPFVYAGEELGLEDAVVAADRALDPIGRDGCRAPLPWDGSARHGWAGESPWLPWPPEAETRNVEAQTGDDRSMLSLYRALLAERRKSTALRVGDLRLLDAADGVVAYERAAADGDERLVAINFRDEAADALLAGSWDIVVSTVAGRSGVFDGRLDPDEAVILAPQ